MKGLADHLLLVARRGGITCADDAWCDALQDLSGIWRKKQDYDAVHTAWLMTMELQHNRQMKDLEQEDQLAGERAGPKLASSHIVRDAGADLLSDAGVSTAGLTVKDWIPSLCCNCRPCYVTICRPCRFARLCHSQQAIDKCSGFSRANGTMASRLTTE